MPGLGTSYGRGGATTFPPDLKNSDSILVMGSNMAECHPVAFRWVMQAKTRPVNPATIISVDPRFTRTSAMANIYAPVRAGSDIVFLGALIKYALDKHVAMLRRMRGRPRNTWTEHERFFHDYLTRYTNAPTLINDDFRDTEDLGGLFAGYNAETRKYDQKQWRYAALPAEHPHEKEGGRAAASWPCVATPPSRARPISPPCTTSTPAT